MKNKWCVYICLVVLLAHCRLHADILDLWPEKWEGDYLEGTRLFVPKVFPMSPFMGL